MTFLVSSLFFLSPHVLFSPWIHPYVRAVIRHVPNNFNSTLISFFLVWFITHLLAITFICFSRFLSSFLVIPWYQYVSVFCTAPEFTFFLLLASCILSSLTHTSFSSWFPSLCNLFFNFCYSCCCYYIHIKGHSNIRFSIMILHSLPYVVYLWHCCTTFMFPKIDPCLTAPLYWCFQFDLHWCVNIYIYFFYFKVESSIGIEKHYR